MTYFCHPNPFVSSEVEKRGLGARKRFSTSLETNGLRSPGRKE
jgi:hypothetical protein